MTIMHMVRLLGDSNESNRAVLKL